MKNVTTKIFIAFVMLLICCADSMAVNVMDQRWMSIKNGIWQSGLKADIATRDGDVITINADVQHTFNVASSEIVLNQQTPEPFNFSGWIKRHPGGKAEKGLVAYDLLLLYTDGTHKWDVLTPVTLQQAGKWIHTTYLCKPIKPLRAIRVLGINNNSDTPVSIKDISVTPAVNKNAAIVRTVGTLENNVAAFSFAKPDNNGSLVVKSIRDKRFGVEFINPQAVKGNLWRISLKDSRSATPLVLHGGGKVDVSIKNRKMTACWNAVPLPDGGTMQVVATAEMQDKANLQWHINVDVKSDNYTLQHVAYPMLNGLTAPGKPEKTHLLIPQDIGRLINNPAKNFPGSLTLRYGTNAMTMQFIALYGEKSGLYIACKDGEGYTKEMRFVEQFGRRGNFNFEVFTLTPHFERQYSRTFPVEFRLFTGDWFTACSIYRQWAMQQKWTKCGPMELRKNFPSPLKRIGLSVYGIQNIHYNKQQLANRKKLGPNGFSVIPDDKLFDTVGGVLVVDAFVNHIKSLHDYFGFPLEVFNHPYLDHFGRACPRYMLLRGYPKAARLIREMGCYTVPWTTALRMDTTIERYKRENGEQGAVLDEKGKPVVLFADGCMKALMCPATEYWQNCLFDSTGKLLQSNLTGIYMDEMSSTGVQICYSKDHGHTVGGGNYGLNGYRKVMEKMHTIHSQKYPEYYSLAEQNSEYLIGVHDVNYMFLLFHHDLVPAFQAVYHDYSLCNSRLSGKFQDWAEEYAYADRSGKTNVEEVAMLGMRNFAFGIHPGVVRLNLPTYSPDAAAIAKHLGEMWLANQKYVMFGQMLRAPEIISGNGAITTGLPFRDSTQYEYPAVRASAWLAQDKSVALVLTNAAKTLLAPEIKFNASKQIKTAYVTIRDRSNQQVVYSGKTDDIRFRMPIEPRTIKVLELIPEESAAQAVKPELPELIVWANHNLLEITAGNTGKMQVHLENTTSQPCSGVFKINIADTFQVTPAREIKFELPANSSKVLDLAITIPAGVKGLQSFDYTVCANNNFELKEEFNIGVRQFAGQQSSADKKKFSAVYLEKIPVGRLPESLPAITNLKAVSQLQAGKFTPSPTQTRIVWNQDALVMEFIVEDKLHNSPVPGEMIWQGDCIQIGLGFPRIESDTKHYYLQHELYLALIDGKPYVSCEVKAYDKFLKLKAERQNGKTYYRLTVPKSLLLDIQKGKKYPFSFTVNEHNGKTFAGWQEWTRGICGGKNKGAWGEIVLE